GALHGLMRTRAFVQDDAHVFCTEVQIEAEVARFCTLLHAVYADFGFADVAVRFATRPALRAGADAAWDRAEAALAAAATQAGLAFALAPGEGAFYGPKLEFHLGDAHGRSWQCGTIQLDFVLPERLAATYRDHGDAHTRPVMLHHAVLGSFERFIAMLLEHHRGRLPLWLAPEQVVVATIGAAAADYGAAVRDALVEGELRAVLDARPDTLGRKIVQARALEIPVVVAVGASEAANGTVSIRRADGAQQILPLTAAVATLAAEARRIAG
ncbi:MAG: threonine--tRNA ligase, partial [Proteobacteria bacterium]|nr:threonine--tRNA ligase [Pseudomonadota bacterium]